MTKARRKQRLPVDEDGHPIDIDGIDASPEAVGGAMVKPGTRRRVERAGRERTKARINGR